MNFDIKTDQKYWRHKEVCLPGTRKRGNSTEPFLKGEWITVDASGEVRRITRDPHDNISAFPVLEEAGPLTKKLDVAVGLYEAETDNYCGAPSLNDPLTIASDGGTPSRGRLREAVAGEPVIAMVVKPPGPDFNGLVFRTVIIIYVTEQIDGYTCQLDPRSKVAIKAQASRPLVRSIFISHDTYHNAKPHIELLHGSMWAHIAGMLTDIPAENLQDLVRVVFVDSKTRKTLFDFSAHHVTCKGRDLSQYRNNWTPFPVIEH